MGSSKVLVILTIFVVIIAPAVAAYRDLARRESQGKAVLCVLAILVAFPIGYVLWGALHLASQRRATAA